jgi:hypothetical protein
MASADDLSVEGAELEDQNKDLATTAERCNIRLAECQQIIEL